MAHGLPSVVSSICAEGIMVTSGEQTIIADSLEAFTQAVIDLFEIGYGFVEKNFSWERCLVLCQKAIPIDEKIGQRANIFKEWRN